MEAAAEIAGSDDVSAVGVCAGGLTTAALLGRLAFQCRQLIHSATFAVTQLDYGVPSTIGMLGIPDVMDRAARSSQRRGTLDSRAFGALFSMLRPNDLIWNYWVNNNLLGEDPPAFDVLAWNADGTSLPAELHAEFLRVFLHNALARSDLTVNDCPVDLQKVGCDVLSRRRPHRPSGAVAGVLRHHQPLRGPERLRAVLLRSHPVPGQPARIEEDVDDHRTGQGRDPGRVAGQATETPGGYGGSGGRSGRAPGLAGSTGPRALGSLRHPGGTPAPGLYVHNE